MKDNTYCIHYRLLLCTKIYPPYLVAIALANGSILIHCRALTTDVHVSCAPCCSHHISMSVLHCFLFPLRNSSISSSSWNGTFRQIPKWNQSITASSCEISSSSMGVSEVRYWRWGKGRWGTRTTPHEICSDK